MGFIINWFFGNHFIYASETDQGTLLIPNSEVFISEGFVHQENLSTVIPIYIAAGTHVSGIKNIKYSVLSNNASSTSAIIKASTEKSKSNRSKSFAKKQKIELKATDKQHETRIEKIKKTLFLPFSNPSMPTLQKEKFVAGIASSQTSLQHNSGIVLFDNCTIKAFFIPKLREEGLALTLPYLQASKYRSTVLRGPPINIFA